LGPKAPLKTPFLSVLAKKQRENKQPKIKRESENLWFIGAEGPSFKQTLVQMIVLREEILSLLFLQKNKEKINNPK
jgi:hypothetical protein